MQGMVVNAYHLRALDAELERSQVQGYPGLYSKTLSQNNKDKNDDGDDDDDDEDREVMKFIEELPSKRQVKTQNATGIPLKRVTQKVP